MSRHHGEQLSCEERIKEFERITASKKLANHAMNCHHIIWMGRDHKDFVRATQVLQPQMYLPAHNALHADCQAVPKFNNELLKVIRNNFDPTDDTMESLDRLLVVINNSGNVIRPEVKDLCLHSLESQIPFLRNNISPAKGYHR